MMRQFSSRFFAHLVGKGNKCRFSGRHCSWEDAGTRALKLFGEGLVGLFDGILFKSSGLHQEAVFLGERIALPESVITVSLFGEAFFAKGVCGEKAIGAGVPERGVIMV